MVKASFPDLVREHRTEPVPPEPNRLVADVDAPLEQSILNLSQRQRIAEIHHHHEVDHLGRAVEITEGIAHRRRLRNLARRLKPIYSDNAAGIALGCVDRFGSLADFALRRGDGRLAPEGRHPQLRHGGPPVCQKRTCRVQPRGRPLIQR